jgi:hypothetical protein
MGRTIAGAEAGIFGMEEMEEKVRENCDLLREGDGGLLMVSLLTLTRLIAVQI